MLSTCRDRFAAAAAALTFLGAILVFVLAAQAGEAEARRSDHGASGLQLGSQATDFELPLLKDESNAEGEKGYRVTDEKIKLSSFRGKKVVCLFLSSYT
jgi:hypothetical protein